MVGGRLDIVIMMNPFGEWDEKQGDHPTDFTIGASEWWALFFDLDALGLPEWEESVDGEDTGAYYERQKILFQQNAKNKGYEMLGRIWDTYQDAEYLPSEVNQLLEECTRLKQSTNNSQALSALANLISACYEALKISSGLRLLSD
jgi:hypothetical protein